MKILHVLYSNIYSGAENVVCNIIQNLPSEYECIYLAPEGPIEDALKKRNITYYPVKTLNISQIKYAVNELKPDIVHAHDFRASVYAAYGARGIRVISHLHNNPPWIKTWNPKTVLYACACSRFEKVLLVSESIIKEAVFSKRLADKAEVVGNPFDKDKILRLSKDEISFVNRECSNQNMIGWDVLFVGRLTNPKNPLAFIRIMEQVLKQGLNIHAALIGDGDLKEDCETLILNLQIQDKVSVIGFCENPYPYMAKAKILCMPSVWEGFGLVALEAMALGIPVLASPVGGLVKLVNKACGDLCSTEEEFVANIIRLLSDKEMYKEKQKGALQQAEKYSNAHSYIKKISDIYKKR